MTNLFSNLRTILRLGLCLICILLFSMQQANAQQELGMHMMRDVGLADKFNPAIFGDQRFYIGVGSVYANFSHDAGTINEIIKESNGQNVLDVNTLISLADEDNILNTNFELETFRFRFRTKGLALGLSHSMKSNTFFQYDQSLPSLFWNGNAQYIGERIDFGPIQKSSAYHEWGLSVGYEKNGFSIGGRVKYLSGIGDVSTGDNTSASLYTSDDIYQLELNTDFSVNSSWFDDRILFDSIGGSFGIEYGLDDLLSFERLFSANTGVAFDLGLRYQMGEKLDLAVSVLDIGEIEWTENVTNYNSQGSFTYEGFDFSNLVNNDDLNFEGTLDTLEEIFDFQETSRAYKTKLTPKVYASALYRINETWRVGGMFYGEWIDGGTNNTAVALSADARLNQFITVGATYAWRNKTFDNLGLNAVAQLGPVQVFAATDNLIALVRPFDAKNVNGRVGLSLFFGGGEE